MAIAKIPHGRSTVTCLGCASILLFLIGCSATPTHPKVYWFIPDGVRADPNVFTLYDWAEQGELPNIKLLMEQGSYGYSIPTFPSHTPTNFATLLTGVYPKKHGVADGPMHVEGAPLNKVSVSGFSSVAKKVEPIWVTLEKQGFDVTLLSVPGTTPPELEHGITVRGRWGGWGADFPAINFQQKDDTAFRRGRGSRLFFFGPPLTKYIEGKETRWNGRPARNISLEQYGANTTAYIVDSTPNNITDYDTVVLEFDKQVKLHQGEWSSWQPITLQWQVGEHTQPIATKVNVNIIKLDSDGFFRIRFFYDNLNEFIAQPGSVAQNLNQWAGPMVDFVDNFPPQLIYYPEDKQTFLDEAKMSLDWHKKAAATMLDTYNPDFYIQDVYTPNQMLTSRWWMGNVDPTSIHYLRTTPKEREQSWKEIKEMYKRLDAILGEYIKRADDNTIILFSSDHGAVPLDKWVRLNNLFKKKGWLKATINPETGEPIIDWENSTVIYLKMAHVYINPEGLGGNWTRASGPAYRKLREEVRTALLGLEDPLEGIKPVVAAYTWEDVPAFLNLPTDRVGDLVLVNEAGYGWNEEITQDGKLFDIPLKTGYKQAVIAQQHKGMWTPFIIMGKGIKKNYKLPKPINHVDQYATLMRLLNISATSDGRVLHEIFD